MSKTRDGRSIRVMTYGIIKMLFGFEKDSQAVNWLGMSYFAYNVITDYSPGNAICRKSLHLKTHRNSCLHYKQLSYKNLVFSPGPDISTLLYLTFVRKTFEIFLYLFHSLGF